MAQILRKIAEKVIISLFLGIFCHTDGPYFCPVSLFFSRKLNYAPPPGVMCYVCVAETKDVQTFFITCVFYVYYYYELWLPLVASSLFVKLPHNL